MTESLAYLNGAFLSQSRAQIPLHDAGFVMGVTVTDLCRTFRHRLYRWPDHLQRFRESCLAASIPIRLSNDELTGIAERLVQENSGHVAPDQDLALVVFATPGAIGYYLGQPGGAGDSAPTLGMHTYKLPFARFARLFREGAQLVVPSTRHLPAECIDPRIKQRSRLHWWLADREVHGADPGAFALLADGNGYLTETAAANFLVASGGTVYSPPRDCILPGISLRVVRELCCELGIPFRYEPLTIEACELADEAFLTNTSFGLAGVRKINASAIPWPGPITERLLAAWSGKIGIDIRQQILSNP